MRRSGRTIAPVLAGDGRRGRDRRCRNKRRKSDEVIHCIWCDNSNDKTDLGLGSDTAKGVSVVINFADMRGAKSGSRFMHVDPSKIGKTPRGLVFAFNQLWGGSGLDCRRGLGSGGAGEQRVGAMKLPPEV